MSAGFVQRVGCAKSVETSTEPGVIHEMNGYLTPMPKTKTKEWKLYVWNNVRNDYTPGIAFAVGRDIEEARQAIRARCTGDRAWEWSSYAGELMKDPEILDFPAGDWISGGG